jgi:hypothetical protein
MLAAMIAVAWDGAANAFAQDTDEAAAVTARVHGTFQDSGGGLGVLSGDMSIVRFEVRNGALMAIGRIVGALADSAGNPMGHVDEELAVPVGAVASTCNQLRLDRGATDAEILHTRVHFDREVAGFDSREGAAPKALPVLCRTGELVERKRTPDALARALNEIASLAKSRQE